MGFQDRSYYRDPGSSARNPLTWLLTGSVPLFTAFGIRVRAHASLIVVVVLVLLFGLGQGFTWQDRVESMSILFGVVLLHEFGHCFAARYMGGDANEIMMTPLGGLAFTMAPRRPLATFVTVAAGPGVNVLICLVTGVMLWLMTGWLPWNPWGLFLHMVRHDFLNIPFHLNWIYAVSYVLLLFNLLPIFPLDGGQMLQSILWPKLGYYRSMNFACISGMVGAVLMAMVGLARGGMLLVFIAAGCFVTSFTMRKALQAAGPEEFQDAVDYSASLYATESPKRRRKASRRAVAKAQRIARQEQLEQAKIDAILSKVSAHGMQSLSWWEKRTLRKATDRQRRRDLELSRGR